MRRKYGRKRLRTRHQDGWVQKRGRNPRTWYGHYYVYELQPDKTEKRRHRGITLGDRATVSKWEAEAKLRQIIATANRGMPKAADQTLEWFVTQRFFPLKSNWEPSTRATNLGFWKNQMQPAIGKQPLALLDKLKCQIFLNDLAEKGYSFTVVDHCRTMLKAIMSEAVDQDLIFKDPTRKLCTPAMKAPVKPVMSNKDARALLDSLPFRDRLIAMIAAFCAMRPGEIFGLHWSSWKGDHFQIKGTAWRGTWREGKTKTKGSRAPVVIPDALQPLLEMWRAENQKPLESLIFPSEKGTPIRPENWLRRRIKPIAKELGISTPATFQVLRRTFATNAQGHGNPKDVQSHLRHSNITTTLGIYTQPVSSSVRRLVNDVTDAVLKKESIN